MIVRKLYIPIVAAFITAAFYIISTGSNSNAGESYFGETEAIGTDEDADARYSYELMLLRDPATGKIPAHIREKELAFAAMLPNDAIINPDSRTTSVNWESRGPWNVGGRTRAFAVDVTNENNLIAGSCSGGMWRSTDQGHSWKQTTLPTQHKSISCVTQDTRPGHTNVWYYGTGEAYGASASVSGAYYLGNGIYKSTDSGKTWNILPATTSSNLNTLDTWGDIIWNIVTDPSDLTHDVIYAASYGGVYRSADGGTTWNLVLGSFGTSYFTDVAISGTGVVYATLSSDGPTRGVFRSDNGTTFTNITPAGYPLTYNRVKIGICPSHENQIYFLGNTPGYGQPDTSYGGTVEWNSLWRYTYISGDGIDSTGGGYWQNRSHNLPTTGGPFDKFTSQGSYDLVVKVKPNDTNVVFIGGTNLYRSTSAFANSNQTTFIGGYEEHATLPVVDLYLNHHPDQHELIFMPSNPNRMISANDGGMFYTNDNTAPSIIWSSLNNGYLTTMFYTCAIDHAAIDDIIIGGAQDNGSWYTNSANPTAPWTTPRGGDGSYCAIADNSSAYYFSIQGGKMMRAKLTPSGRVDSFARIDPSGGRGYLFINPFTLDPNNNDIMYLAGGRSLWRNNNLSGIPYASNWDSIATNWSRISDSVATSNLTITAVAVSKHPANRVYFGTAAQRVFRIDSADAGMHTPKNITSKTTGHLFPSGATVSCIAVDPSNADHVIVVFSNYNVNSLFSSRDGGTTWAKIGGNLEENNNTGIGNGPSCRWASIIPVSGGTVYLVGTSVGLFATTQLNDTNTVWVQQGTNTIGSSVVTMIDHRVTDGLVVAATHSNGIFSTRITQVANINGVKEIAASAPDLHFTNYPNPFSNETTIKFELEEKNSVSIHVYDQAGRLIKTLADEDMLRGEKKYTYNTRDLSPGIYYCTLKTGNYSETRKLLKQ